MGDDQEMRGSVWDGQESERPVGYSWGGVRVLAGGLGCATPASYGYSRGPSLDQAQAPLSHQPSPRDFCPMALRGDGLFDDLLLGSSSESVSAVAPLPST